MAWTDKQYAVTIKAIATVESDMRYDAINYRDPITVGIGQWFGVRAAALLKRILAENKESANNMSPSIRSDLTSRSADDAYWNSRYLSSGEGESLRPILRNNALIQNLTFKTDIDEYLRVARAWGMNPDTNVKAVQFFCTMYHQAPARTKDVLDNIGTSPTLEQIHQGALNNPVLGQYVTRQNTCYQIIKNENSEGVTLPGSDGGDVRDDAPPPSDSGGDDLDPIERTVEGDTLQRVQVMGDSLYAYFKNRPPLLLVPSTPNEYLATQNEIGGGTVIINPGDHLPKPTPDDPSDPTPPPPAVDRPKWHNPTPIEHCNNRYGDLSYGWHSGIDLRASTRGVAGDPLYAIHRGRVVRVGGHGEVLYKNSGRGIIVDIGMHGGDRMFFYYGHCDRITVKQGDWVEAGDTIAIMGGTGANHLNTDFPVHLHMVVIKNKTINPNGPTVIGRNTTIDPERWLRSKGLMLNMNACPYN